MMNMEFYKEYIRNHGHHYSGWYKLITFKTPVQYEGTTMITGVFCNDAGLYGRDCIPFVKLSNPIGSEYELPFDKLSPECLDAVEKAMLEGDACTNDWDN